MLYTFFFFLEISKWTKKKKFYCMNLHLYTQEAFEMKSHLDPQCTLMTFELTKLADTLNEGWPQEWTALYLRVKRIRKLGLIFSLKKNKITYPPLPPLTFFYYSFHHGEVVVPSPSGCWFPTVFSHTSSTTLEVSSLCAHQARKLGGLLLLPSLQYIRYSYLMQENKTTAFDIAAGIYD